MATDGPEDSALKAGDGGRQQRSDGADEGPPAYRCAAARGDAEGEPKLRAGPGLLGRCAQMSVPTYPRRVIITDVALNIAPDTDQKRDVFQNAIGFALALGIERPKVAVLAAIEMINTKMPASLDGAILSKMADRGGNIGGSSTGPLDLDAAVDAEAARIKHIDSPVAGIADVFLVPNIEAGNMVYKISPSCRIPKRRGWWSARACRSS